MDIQSLRVLMDINALQSFGTVQNFANQNPSHHSLFSSMLGEVLSQSNSSFQQPMQKNTLLFHGMKDVFLPHSLPIARANRSAEKMQYEPNSLHPNRNFEDIIKRAAQTFNLSEKLISSVIKHESNFNNFTVSKAGAQGLMQLMPGTARFLGVKDSFDPEQNIFGGSRYLRQMLDQFNGDMQLALAAYNAGPGNVKKYGGIPPFKETQSYVKKVLTSLNS